MSKGRPAQARPGLALPASPYGLRAPYRPVLDPTALRRGVRRISRRPNGTPQPNFYNNRIRGGEDRTLDTLLKRQVLYH
jgi:hypothetical protein